MCVRGAGAHCPRGDRAGVRWDEVPALLTTLVGDSRALLHLTCTLECMCLDKAVAL